MFNLIARGLASVSLLLKQPLASYCDVETVHGEALVTKQGEYVSLLRIDGMRRMATRSDVAKLAEGLRLDLSGALEAGGHAIMGFYASDPELASIEIERLNIGMCRRVAAGLEADLENILDERLKLWSKSMRWEAAYLVLWTMKAVLTKEERKQVKEEQGSIARECPLIGDTQKFFLRSEVMAAHHSGFVSRVAAALRGLDIPVKEVSAREGLRIAREAMYRETAGSGWRAILFGDKVMPRLPEDDVKHPRKEGWLWPAIRDQIFASDAITHGGERVEIGQSEYACVDMAVGPEDPRPFVELIARLGADRIPWRCLVVIEGGGSGAMLLKQAGATFLSMFPANQDLRRAFAFLRQKREDENHISVKLRASFATWAPVGEVQKLRRRRSTLAQRLEAWGNCKGATLAGDPLEAAMSSVPVLSRTSTGAPSLALLGDALTMLPWNRAGSPFEEGSVLFRQPNGAMWPYDPSGGSKRPLVLDIFVAPPGSGKSVLANTINLGLCLSPVVIGPRGAKLPLIGKADIGPSAQGFVRLIQEALGPQRRHEAIYTLMQFAPGYEFNVFDLQVGFEYPLPLERAFLQNFLALATLPPDQSTPFEGMSQLIGMVIDEAYRLCTDVPGGTPKRYKKGVEPLVDAAIDKFGLKLHEEDPHWRDVVTGLCRCGEYRLAEVAQRYAVPVMGDLVNAARSEQVKVMFQELRIAETAEGAPEIFARYIYDVVRKYPTLNSPTKLDFGPARIIVLDLAEVAPTGSAAANRQTEMMYLLARHILARNFFLKPDYLEYVPEHVRDYHQPRFEETYQCVKRLDYDEWHRTQGSPLVRAQAELDVREGRKHNVQLGFSSQRLGDMGDAIVSQSTGRFVLRAGDEEEARRIIERFHLSEASADVVRYRLHGPSAAGAPFLAILEIGNAKYEQMLVNTLGPVELWALSTTPGDTALRNRLYERVGFQEALRRLSKIFPAGSAVPEIERRRTDRAARGDSGLRGGEGVIEELVEELVKGHGLGLPLQGVDENPAVVLPAGA
ncbi:MAG TPA: ATP-binding protein [Methylocella sp.]|nr:ATP-binding protein [Methylocella sp.]